MSDTKSGHLIIAEAETAEAGESEPCGFCTLGTRSGEYECSCASGLAASAKSDRLQGVDCPDCEDGTEHSHSIPTASAKRYVWDGRTPEEEARIRQCHGEYVPCIEDDGNEGCSNCGAHKDRHRASSTIAVPAQSEEQSAALTVDSFAAKLKEAGIEYPFATIEQQRDIYRNQLAAAREHISEAVDDDDAALSLFISVREQVAAEFGHKPGKIITRSFLEGVDAEANKRIRVRLIAARERISGLARAGDVMESALQRAKQFIRNGRDLGFIRMPDLDCPDTAHETPGIIDAALRTYAAAKASGE